MNLNRDEVKTYPKCILSNKGSTTVKKIKFMRQGIKISIPCFDTSGLRLTLKFENVIWLQFKT